MNFFAEELEKLKSSGCCDCCGIMNDGTVTASGVLYKSMSKEIKAKIEFVKNYGLGRYDALRVTILNIKTGPVDDIVMKFADVMGKKKMSSDKGLKEIEPYVRAVDGSEPEWWIYKPGKSDWDAMVKEIVKYLRIFS